MDEPVPGDFHIQASPEATSIPKLVLKHDESFLVCDRRGDFPAHFDGELGFYHAGTRHLRWFELRLNGERPLLLDAAISPANDQILVGMTNADVLGPDGSVLIPRNTLHVDRQVTIDGVDLLQAITVTSFHAAPCEITLEIIFAADFRDVFEVRGTHRPARGRLLPEEREDGRVRLRYRGLDDIERVTTLTFAPPPLLVAAHRAVQRIALAPGSAFQWEVRASAAPDGGSASPPAVGPALARRRASPENLPARAARVTTDNEAFNALLARSLADLDVLLTTTPQGRVPYAGVPWYVAPFGRDSLITAMQLLPWAPEVARDTLRFLAHWQGRVSDPFREEEPGKILHEYRLGEMANCREIPFVPYYGTIDATPLFVWLLAEYVRWTGDVALARELWPAATAALGWMRAAAGSDGFLAYRRRSPLGLANQGWKDSWDSVMHADGALARPPIALVEVQAYAYAAWEGAAALAPVVAGADAAAWRRQAAALRDAFAARFWMETESFPPLAIDGDGEPCEVVSSNPGHALWAGIVDERRAAAVAKRLLADDMFSGWGIRTLSARERRYNPMSYHNGSVWPHDNAIAAAGFRRYRLLDHIVAVATGIFEASRHFEHARLPELFCGFPRRPDHGPIPYPIACSPQAWAAGSPLHLLTALLGLQANALRGRLTFLSPVLPPWLRSVEIHDLRVGSGSVDVGISRGRDGASVELIGRRGDVELIVRR